MASIFLANLDADAIGLGASCTRPEVLARDTQATRKRITLEAEDDNSTVGFTPAGPIQALTNGSAQVSVSDCLACSGCVTSAESVLLAEQAAPKLGILCNEGRPVDVVIDRAALASVAQKFDSTPAEALARLRTACTAALPVRRVVAATDAQDLQLLETLHEFERRLEREDAGVSASRETPPPTAVSATSYKDPKTNQIHEYTVEPKTEAPITVGHVAVPGHGLCSWRRRRRTPCRFCRPQNRRWPPPRPSYKMRPCVTSARAPTRSWRAIAATSWTTTCLISVSY